MCIQFPAHRTLLIGCIQLERLYAGPPGSRHVHPGPVLVVRPQFIIDVSRSLDISPFPTRIQLCHLIAVPIPSSCQDVWFLLIFRVQIRSISGRRAYRRSLTGGLGRCWMRSGISIADVRERCGGHRCCYYRGWCLSIRCF